MCLFVCLLADGDWNIVKKGKIMVKLCFSQEAAFTFSSFTILIRAAKGSRTNMHDLNRAFEFVAISLLTS